MALKKERSVSAERLAEIQRKFDEMGIGTEAEREMYRALRNAKARRDVPRIKRWYTSDRDLMLDRIRRERDA